MPYQPGELVETHIVSYAKSVGIRKEPKEKLEKRAKIRYSQGHVEQSNVFTTVRIRVLVISLYVHLSMQVRVGSLCDHVKNF